MHPHSNERVFNQRGYSSAWHGWHAFLQACINDIKVSLGDPKAFVASRLEEAKHIESTLFGRRLENADVLDVGPGQVPIQLIYFNRMNRAVGIDTNRIIHRRTPWTLIQVARESGVIRATKTLGRWLIGRDTRLRRRLAEALDVPMQEMRWPDIFVMDVRNMTFQDHSFDFVYSRSVLHHLKDPSPAIREIKRVLRPKGFTYLSLHLWTCPNGYTYVPATTWTWPHLRGLARASEIDQERNRMRLREWQQQFQTELPGCEIEPRGPDDPNMIAAAQELIKTELADYSLDELISYELSVTWRHP